MIDLGYRIGLGIAFACIFAFRDAQDRQVSNLVINLAVLLGILIGVVDWVQGVNEWLLIANVVISIAFMAGGIWLNSKGIMGSGDGYFFGVITLFFPVFLFSAFNMPLAFWTVSCSFLLALIGAFGDVLLHGREKQQFAFGPFLLGGFLCSLILYFM